MHADLDRLIRLQSLETAAEQARRTIAEEPSCHQQLDARLAAALAALDREQQRLSANLAARREIDKELTMPQGRLSKYKDQLMAVKTNREYQAMQKELETAQHEIRVFEDRMLDRMIEFDEVSAEVKRAEQVVAEERKAIDEERRQLARRVAEAASSLDVIAVDRAALASQFPSALLATFERLVKHRGSSAVVEVRDERCTACQVRVRPQVFNELRRNEIVFQCESCQRILYHAGTASPPPVNGA
jgi:predicted  nucleic acid-binding Zn-ribbon protein